MRTTFSLTQQDYRLLERAVANRFQNTYGRLNTPFFMQVFAWMFITLAVVTYYKQWQRTPDDAAPYGVILVFAALGFALAALRPTAGQRLYWKYLFASNPSFTAEQSIEIRDTSLVTESPIARSEIPRSAIIDHSEDSQNHYLFLTGVQAIIIPKQATACLGDSLKAFLAGSRSEA